MTVPSESKQPSVCVFAAEVVCSETTSEPESGVCLQVWV